MAGWMGSDDDGNRHGDANVVPKSWLGQGNVGEMEGWMYGGMYVYILDIRGTWVDADTDHAIHR